MQGPSKIWSKTPMDPEMIAKYERVTGERWVFRNISMRFLALASARMPGAGQRLFAVAAYDNLQYSAPKFAIHGGYG
jgi:hypothetical protein